MFGVLWLPAHVCFIRLTCLFRHFLQDIGFMSELMRFEERELGTKTAGVNMASSLPSQGTAQGDGAQTQQRQQQHRAVSSVGAPTRAPESAHVYSSWGRLRDSMPPIQSSPTNMGHFSGDREQEVKGHKYVRPFSAVFKSNLSHGLLTGTSFDSFIDSGAWVHARRDQMSERFQPNRRSAAHFSKVLCSQYIFRSSHTLSSSIRASKAGLESN